jgi:hypothetical protein
MSDPMTKERLAVIRTLNLGDVNTMGVVLELIAEIDRLQNIIDTAPARAYAAKDRNRDSYD